MKINRAKAGIAALATGALIACGSFALASEGVGVVEPAQDEGAATSEQQEQQGEAASVAVSAEDIQAWCGTCHFTNIENASINSWNQTNVDAAMVESMVPMLDDETIQGIADYFAQIEPPAQDEGEGEQGEGDQSQGGQH